MLLMAWVARIKQQIHLFIWLSRIYSLLTGMYDHDFLIVYHSNFSFAMHVFRDNEVYCKPDMTSSWFIVQGVLHAVLFVGFWKRDYDFLTAFHINLLSVMNGFRDDEVLLQARYDVIVISPLGGAFYLGCMVSEITSQGFIANWKWFHRDFSARLRFRAIFRVGFWKSEHNFRIAFHNNFLSGMHGFWDKGFIANRKWRHRDFSAKGRFTQVLLMESEMFAWWLDHWS